ncbi:MAG: hypothetical protein ACKPKO_20625 [Candidatus Fonsibacter sp.]
MTPPTRSWYFFDGEQRVRQEVLQLTVVASAARERMACGPFGKLSHAEVEERRSVMAELGATRYRGDELRSARQELEAQLALNLESGGCDAALADAKARMRILDQGVGGLQARLVGLEAEREQAVIAMLEYKRLERRTCI